MRISLWDRYWSARCIGTPRMAPIRDEAPIPYRKAEFEGASRLARRLGLSPSHVWRVATGRRRSRRLEKALREAGVKVAAGRAAR